MEQNKVRTYLLYAIGEVALVMIGILLALQVNNWNEERKSEERFFSILKEMQTDLITDVKAINARQPFGTEIDSVAKRMLAGEVSRSEYEDPANWDLFWVGLQYIPFSQQTNAFTKFKSFNDEIDSKYQEMVNQINDFYLETSDLIIHRQDIFIETIEERHDYLTKNYDWYYLLRKGDYNQEMVDYYLNDPEYKNFISRYKDDQLFRPGGYITTYKNSAILVYFMINDLLGGTATDESVKDIKQPLNDEYIQLIRGSYKRSNDNFIYEVKEQSGILFMTFFNDDFRFILIKKDTAYTFLNDPATRITFNMDSTKSVTSFSMLTPQAEQPIIFNRLE